MSPTDLEEMFSENPTTTYRITLSSGDIVLVPNARSIIIEGFTMRVTTFIGPERFIAKDHKIVSIPNIALIEPLDRSQPPPREQRRRKR